MDNEKRKRQSYTIDRIKNMAKGRISDILENVAGIPAEILDGIHHSCPSCGGTDRFRLIDADAGAVLCNQCFNTNNGDFIEAVRHFRNVDRSEALRLIADHLGVQGETKRQARPATTQSGKTSNAWELKIDIGKPAAIYRYTDESSKTLFEVLRYIGTYPDGTTDKTFRQRRPDPDKPGKWLWKGVDTVRQVPYKLPRVLSAKFIIVTEGEKDADRLNRLFGQVGQTDAVATTSARGAKNSSPWFDFAKEFKLYEKTVRVIPDNDAEGLSFGRNVCRAILSAVFHAPKEEKFPPPNVKMIELPGLPEKGDFSDWIERLESEGKTPQDILTAFSEIVKAAPPVTDETIGEWNKENIGGSFKDGKTEQKNRLEWEPFPVDVFPESLRKYIVESAAAINIDPAYVGPSVLTVVASVIGSAIKIELKTGWQEPSILWTVTVADSGSGKSPGLDAAVEPLRKFQMEADKHCKEEAETFENLQAAYQADFSIWKLNRKKNPSEQPPEKPIPPIAEAYMADDTTPEALIEVLEQNPFGVCIAKDELGGWFGSFGAYGSGGGSKESKDLSFWLSVHGGRYFRVNRKTGKRIAVASTPAVSICGNIPTGMLRKTLAENEHYFDAGLAARILFAMPPDIPAHWTDKTVSDVTKNQYWNTIERIFSQRIGFDALNPESPSILTLSESAKSQFVGFYNANADERAGMESATQKGVWAKLTGYAARIALVFHVVKWSNGETADFSPVDGQTMESAIRLIQWYKREALRIIETMRGEVAQIDLEATAILDIIRRNGGAITVRELQRRRSAYQADGGAELAERKLRELVEKRLLTAGFEKGKSGPGKEIFQLTTANDNDRFPIFPEENAKPVIVIDGKQSENDFSAGPLDTPEPALVPPSSPKKERKVYDVETELAKRPRRPKTDDQDGESAPSRSTLFDGAGDR